MELAIKNGNHCQTQNITEVTVTRFSPKNSRVEQFPNGFHVSDDMLFYEFS